MATAVVWSFSGSSTDSTHVPPTTQPSTTSTITPWDELPTDARLQLLARAWEFLTRSSVGFPPMLLYLRKPAVWRNVAAGA